MRLLFVHHSFPGQFLHLLRALASPPQHQIIFITRPGQGEIAGVTKITYDVAPASDRTHPDARPFDAAMRRAAAVAEVAAGLRAAGFHPDLIIGHESWGETLNLPDIWPAARQIGYREYFYHTHGADVGCDPEFPLHPSQLAGVRANNAVGLLALLPGTPGVSPTAWQRGLYPAWAQPGISLVPDAVDLAFCRPDPAVRASPFRLGPLTIEPDRKLVTFVARSLEPYRGFHIFVRALPRLMARRDVEIICAGGSGVSYGPPPLTGTWRDRLLAEIAGRIDPARLHTVGILPYADHIRLLQRADVHTYLSYPFIASWSLREALACGCTVIASDTAPAREFITDRSNGRLVPPLDPTTVADQALALLDDDTQRQTLGSAARAWAETNLQMDTHLEAWLSAVRAALA